MDSMSNKKLVGSFMNLPQPHDKVQCMYAWIDGTLQNVRCKTRTWNSVPKSATVLPRWEFCGSATCLDVTDIADVYAQPVALYDDPFRGSPNKLVLCETYTREGKPTFANNRIRLSKAEETLRDHYITYEFQQSYSLLRKDGKPLSHLDPAYLPGSKSGFVCGRPIAEAHYKASLFSGLLMSSMEPATNTGQWTYSVGPASGTAVGDDTWISRFIIGRVAEDFGVDVSFNNTSANQGYLNLISSSIVLHCDRLVNKDRERLVEAFFSRLSTKEKQIKILNKTNGIKITGFIPDADPYALILKVVDAVSASACA